jgi:helicase associated protein
MEDRVRQSNASCRSAVEYDLFRYPSRTPNHTFSERYVLRQWTKAHTAFWERGFAALCKFRAREGHCCPSRDHVEDAFRLGVWVDNQRSRKGLLPLARQRRLDAIGFIWDWREHQWEQGFLALFQFKRREGHCCVPRFHVEGKYRLGEWVYTQRRNRTLMSAERTARLNKIGFVWRTHLKGIAAEAGYQTDN